MTPPPSTFAFWRKKLAFLVLFGGVAFVVWRFQQKEAPHSVVLRHRLLCTRCPSRLTLRGEIRNRDGERVWHGEFRISPPTHRHTVSLRAGTYTAYFSAKTDISSVQSSTTFRTTDSPISLDYFLK